MSYHLRHRTLFIDTGYWYYAGQCGHYVFTVNKHKSNLNPEGVMQPMVMDKKLFLALFFLSIFTLLKSQHSPILHTQSSVH